MKNLLKRIFGFCNLMQQYIEKNKSMLRQKDEVSNLLSKLEVNFS